MTTQTIRLATSNPKGPMRLGEIRMFLRLAEDALVDDDAPVNFEQTLRGRSLAIAVEARRARPTPGTQPPLETK